jgi:hypothetical protein
MSRWFRVVGYGTNGGAAKRSAEAAWESALRAIPEWLHGSQTARFHLTLVEGTTRKAVESADVSRSNGRHRRGEWWVVQTSR